LKAIEGNRTETDAAVEETAVTSDPSPNLSIQVPERRPMPTPPTAVRIPQREKQELQALADAAGVSLSDAFRHGARLYLMALNTRPHRKGARLAA
jgi:hypothetical protein